MAKQIGHQIKGRIDDYSFYHDRVHGYLVRRTGGVTSKQYHTDQRYAAARDASSEFAHVSKAGKLIRDAFRLFIDQVKDGTMVNRMNKELVALKQADNKNPRGKRRPETMLMDTDANKWFRIFQFNEKAKIYELMGTSQRLPPTWDSGGKLSAPMIDPSRFPAGATHAGLTLVRSVIEFENGCFETRASRMVLISRSGDKQGAIYRTPTKYRVPTGIEIVCLQVVFFKEQNGTLIQLKEMVHGMGVVAINKLERKYDEGHGKPGHPLQRTSRRVKRIRRNVRLRNTFDRSPIVKQKREIETRGG